MKARLELNPKAMERSSLRRSRRIGPHRSRRGRAERQACNLSRRCSRGSDKEALGIGQSTQSRASELAPIVARRPVEGGHLQKGGIPTVESVASSTRIEGSMLSDEEVDRLLSGVDARRRNAEGSHEATLGTPDTWRLLGRRIRSLVRAQVAENPSTPLSHPVWPGAACGWRPLHETPGALARGRTWRRHLC